ncbi:MAG TPA: hypothetical protein VM941_07225 [Pyrinomonadaceae bacterium]|jgi:hypothetical protein|nr:hypothetical protein [Pyrinomonadaceae bacterium]
MKHQSANFSHWLSLLLVAFIFYGTTVEAAHRHGRVLPSAPDTASHVDNEQTKNLTTSKTGCSDCLICQLHQNFSTTLIALRLLDPPTQAPHGVEIVVPRDLLSQSVGPVTGRAPPFIS